MKHIIDVRSPNEFQQGHAEGAINIPVEQLAMQISNGIDIGKADKITLYCLSGGRAGVAKTLLDRAGFEDVTNAGGLSNMI